MVKNDNSSATRGKLCKRSTAHGAAVIGRLSPEATEKMVAEVEAEKATQLAAEAEVKAQAEAVEAKARVKRLKGESSTTRRLREATEAMEVGDQLERSRYNKNRAAALRHRRKRAKSRGPAPTSLASAFAAAGLAGDSLRSGKDK